MSATTFACVKAACNYVDEIDPRLLTLKINSLTPAMVNLHPNPLYVYAQSFGTTVFVLGSFTLFFYVRNAEIRSTLLKEVKEMKCWKNIV